MLREIAIKLQGGCLQINPKSGLKKTPGQQNKFDCMKTGLIKYYLARFWMWLFGWTIAGDLPADKKFVLIAAPHTSNWDFLFGLATVYVLRLKIFWIGKHTLFKAPFGYFMKRLGGIPVRRDAAHGLVKQIISQLQNSDNFIIAVAPSGTRKKAECWKSGFYRIACKAHIPLVCGYLDYSRKQAGSGLSFLPTGNITADMDRIRQFYQGIQGKYPDQVTPVRLMDEDGLRSL